MFNEKVSKLSPEKLELRKKALTVIKKFHRALNSQNIIPEQCYKRNFPYYPLVSYVNNIIAIFLSKNINAIPFFIRISYDELLQAEKFPNSKEYREIVLKYLKQMVYYIREFEEIDKSIEEYMIPDEIKDAEMQEAPSFVEEDF